MKRVLPLLAAVVVVLAVVVVFASCKETNAGRLERMRGDWVSVGNKPPFTLTEENGQYMVTVTKKSHSGSTRTETYLVRDTEGYLFIETGLEVLLTYDKEKDRIRLSPGGEYRRNNHSLNK